MHPFDQVYTINLHSPDFGAASDLAASITEDGLLTIIREYDEVTAEGVSNGWLEESYETQVRSRLFDENGDVRITGGEVEFWNVVDEPEETVEFYANQAQSLMESIMDHNHDVLLNVATNYIVESVAVVRKFPCMWVVQITGAQL